MMIYAAYINYHQEGMSPPFYVGISLEVALKAVPHSGASIVIQKWENGKLIEEIKF